MHFYPGAEMTELAETTELFETTEIAGLAEFKQRSRATWAAGDFPAIAERHLWPVGQRLVQRVGIGRGEDVLDVGCGTGNAAIRAARAGGHVVGVDLTPELFEAGRRLAAKAGVEISWMEGDAEALPVEDESFDVVLSVFGCMFAPRHEVAARELARALRPDGRLAVCGWTPEGHMGEFFQALGGYLPQPPRFASPPLLWGSEDHVRGLFAGTGVTLEFARETVEFPRFASIDDELEFATTKFGPLIMARPLLESQGTWQALLHEMRGLLERRGAIEYLVVLGRKS
jgi:SAM-dependent methyltransferase